MRGDSLPAISRELKSGMFLTTGFGQFRELLRYKLARQGKQLILVDRYTPTTRTCGFCGHVNGPLAARARRWTCPVCGAENRREVNAACSIKRQGLRQAGFADREAV